MTSVTVAEVQARLPDLLAAGGEVVITQDGRPVARLVPEVPRGIPVAGRAKGMLVVHAEDDEHLAGFAE